MEEQGFRPISEDRHPLRRLLGWLWGGVAVVAFAVGLILLQTGYVYRTTCVTPDGRTTQSWSWQIDNVLPFIGTSESGCGTHSALRVGLSALGVFRIHDKLASSQRVAVDTAVMLADVRALRVPADAWGTASSGVLDVLRNRPRGSSVAISATIRGVKARLARLDSLYPTIVGEMASTTVSSEVGHKLRAVDLYVLTDQHKAFHAFRVALQIGVTPRIAVELFAESWNAAYRRDTRRISRMFNSLSPDTRRAIEAAAGISASH